MKIWDCFIYGDEREMLEFRLAELGAVVDGFLVLRSMRDFRGKWKGEGVWPAGFFDDDRVTVVDVDLPGLQAEGVTPWDRENAQRDGMRAPLLQMGLASDDLVLVGDVDEIPDRALLAEVKAKGDPSPALGTWLMLFFYYDLLHLKNCKCLCTRGVLGADILEGKNGAAIRVERELGPLIDRGWHLSYFGGVNAIERKLKSFAHAEFDLPRFTKRELIAARVARGLDLFDRSDETQAIMRMPRVVDGPHEWERFAEFLVGSRGKEEV